jgi:bifunctional polynucleotide phosphatase/kinase
MSWETLDETLVRFVEKKSSREIYSSKIAMFDLDGTLIKTRSGKKYPVNISDWDWLNSHIIPAIHKLIKKNYAIVIVTNQAGAKKGDEQKIEILERINTVFTEIVNICQPPYLEIYISLDKDIYRKPNTTIFEKYILPHFKDRIIENIFYIGDAAGRKGDFADSDRKFAFNIHLLLRFRWPVDAPGASFLTPEEFFLHEPPKPRTWSGFDPKKYYSLAKEKDKLEISEIIAPRLVLLLVGPPASGKSTLSKKIMGEYENTYYVNQDTCRTKTKCSTIFEESLECFTDTGDNPKIIIVDNTNPDADTRKIYITSTRAYEKKHNINIIIKCIVMKQNKELYQHLNVYRERIAYHRSQPIKHIPEVAYRNFYKKYEEPSADEDIDDIVFMDWVPEFHSKYEILMFLQRS